MAGNFVRFKQLEVSKSTNSTQNRRFHFNSSIHYTGTVQTHRLIKKQRNFPENNRNKIIKQPQQKEANILLYK